MKTTWINGGLLVVALWLATGAVAEEPERGVIAARPGASDVLDLEACVREAVSKNDQLTAERFRRKELDGQMNQALSTGLPTIDVTGAWNRSRDPSFALDSTFGGDGSGEIGTSPLDTLLAGFDFLPDPQDIPAQTFWRTSLNLSWTINPVKIIGAVGAAGQGIRRQELILDQTRFAVEEQVVSAYHGIVLAQEQSRAVEAELANQREFLDIVRLRHDMGLVSRLDTLQAAVAVANIEPRLRQARQGVGLAGAQLNALMGRDPESPLSIRTEQVVELDELIKDKAVAMAEQRPDVAQLDVMGDLLRQNRKAQKADMRPYFAVNSSYGYVGKAIKDLDDVGHDFWNASVSLNVPLFDGLLTKGLVQQTSASILRTEAERNGLVRQVRVEILDVIDGLIAARENLTAAELNMERAEELIDTSTMMMREGLADYLTVLQSESGRAQARSNLIQARYDVLTLTAQLKKAIGVSPMLPLTAVPGLTSEES